MDQLDLDLKQYLGDWAEQQPLPVGGKSQLLTAAVAYQEKGRKKTPDNLTTQPTYLLSWAMVYCVDRRISMARIVT